MFIILCCLSLLIPQAITWQNTGELQNALYVYDITVGLGGYIYAGTKIDNGPSIDCGRVFVSQDMWNWQLCDSVPWVWPDDTIEGVYALHNDVGDTLFAGTGLYHSGDVPRVHKSSDGGVTWIPLNSYGSFRVSSRVYALFEDNLGILHLGNNYWGMSAALPRYSTDRGNTWQMPSGVAYNSQQYCFCQSSDNTMYFGAWSDYIHVSTDNGATWVGKLITGIGTGISDSYTFTEVGTDTIFVGVDADIGRIFMTTDRGDFWVEKGDGYFNTTTAIRSLLYASDGAIYAGTSPNAEVFVSVDKGDTWISTGTLSGANTVYKLIEATKTSTVADIDSVFLFASTGPNGDVFRGLLYTIGIDENTQIKPEFTDFQVIPNPFRHKTDISFSTGQSAESIELKIYDVTGRLVKDFSCPTHYAQRPTLISWDKTDETGKKLPAGVYILRLQTRTQNITEKLVALP